ncbi:MAG: nucleotidyltransferase domain-containing protein [Lachnospiraceae bacterium]|nr:nucleotidyltransferase domain-containing protein [Lachnospiraceae bacterium]
MVYEPATAGAGDHRGFPRGGGAVGSVGIYRIKSAGGNNAESGKYIRYAAEFAAANATHIRLGGSFQKGTASPYSDVDISVSGDVRHVKGSFGKCSPAIGALFRSPSADISWRKATAGSCSFSGAGGVALTPLRILRIAG